MTKSSYYARRSKWRNVEQDRTRPASLDRNYKRAQARPRAEKRLIWDSIKQHAPELEAIFTMFPGSTVLSCSVNGKLIGEDYS